MVKNKVKRAKKSFSSESHSSTELDSQIKKIFESDKFGNHLRSAIENIFSGLSKKILDKFSDVERAQLESNQRICHLEEQLKSQVEKVEILEKAMRNTGATTADVAELKERKRSIVCLNVPEKITAFEHEKHLADVNMVGKILQFLDQGCQPMAVYRLGRQRDDGRPRLLKVVLPSSAWQRETLKNANKLRGFNSGSTTQIYLRRSMTKEERLQDYEQRMEKKKQKAQQQTTNTDNSHHANNSTHSVYNRSNLNPVSRPSQNNTPFTCTPKNAQ